MDPRLLLDGWGCWEKHRSAQMDRRWMETELDPLSGSFLTQEHGWLMLILSPQLSFAFIPSALNLYPHHVSYRYMKQSLPERSSFSVVRFGSPDQLRQSKSLSSGAPPPSANPFVRSWVGRAELFCASRSS